jgi:hypothetical protein
MTEEKKKTLAGLFFLQVAALTFNVSFLDDRLFLMLIIATIASIITTISKIIFKRDVFGNMSLGASLMADVHLIPAVFLAISCIENGHVASTALTVMALAHGAVYANFMGCIVIVINGLFYHIKEYNFGKQEKKV